MINTIDLSGNWLLSMDATKSIEKPIFEDTIILPGTTSFAQKGMRNTELNIDCLTDEYKFEGWAWFQREIEIKEEYLDKNIFLFLERTRATTVWVDSQKVDTQNSLCTPHIYNLSSYLTATKHTLTILVDNTDLPTKGGHLTSKDTQTNWNGITGTISLDIYDDTYLENIKVYPEITSKSITLKGEISTPFNGELRISAQSFNSAISHTAPSKTYTLSSDRVDVVYQLGDEALLWDEHIPSLYKLTLELISDGVCIDTYQTTFGLRDFSAASDKFKINDRPTLLRGKHDGLVFPLTGFAPTDTEEWVRILSIAKSYGINHYRFHTCCPPEAAFEAADRLGIYLEPELPFWGTITTEADENHNELEQQYLIEEGFKILNTFGNHPSFVMFSLGNELWGSQERVNEILASYKAFDNRPLYTQGSNNFQFTPCILSEEDFYCGVRFSKDRLIRGSYAMCDAPLGIIQTDSPSTLKNFDEHIQPTQLSDSGTDSVDNTIEIQYGTSTKKVQATSSDDVLIPNIPVVSHEVGQYQTFPNFDEIDKYTGSLKAHNFSVFKQRLEDKGLLDLAPLYFKASGQFAAACYKAEIETAMRSRQLAGFQLLDLQDFPGQGTALVGVLDAFMESKGTITSSAWRQFCSDAVLLGEFEKYTYEANEIFNAHMKLSYYQAVPLVNKKLTWSLSSDKSIIATDQIDIPNNSYGLIDIGEIACTLPDVTAPTAISFALAIEGTDIRNEYTLMLYPAKEIALPECIEQDGKTLYIVNSFEAAKPKLAEGKRVLLIPGEVQDKIPGFYCTDFWCYPMFRSISESMERAVPTGTMGLLIQNTHKALAGFPTEIYSTPQWYHIVSESDCAILDGTPSSFRPIVQMIDNFERNHKLGIVYEAHALEGKLLICTCRLSNVLDHIEVKHFAQSLINYGLSDDFNPSYTLGEEYLAKL